MPQPGDLGVGVVRPPAAADDDDLVAVEAACGEQRHLAVGRLEAGRALDLDELELLRRRAGAVDDALRAVHARGPVDAEGRGQQVDQLVERLPRRCGELLDRLQVHDQVAAGRVAADPQHLDAVERAARRDHRVGHHAGRHLEQHVVDRRTVVALLDDLDRLDVATCHTDGRRDATQRTGDVGQQHSQQERHDLDPNPRAFRHRCAPTRWARRSGTHISLEKPSHFGGETLTLRAPQDSRWRRPVARWAVVSTAARTAASEPTTTTRSFARVTAV